MPLIANVLKEGEGYLENENKDVESLNQISIKVTANVECNLISIKIELVSLTHLLRCLHEKTPALL